MNFFKVRTDTLQPQAVFGGNVGGNFFQALGVRAAAGRLIGPEDVQVGYHNPVAVVSWSFWKSRFDLDPGIVGKKIMVGDDSVTIVGVAERGFYGLSEEAQQDIWLPTPLGPSPGWRIGLLGRLEPGVSMQQARAQMAVLFQTVVNAPDAGPFVSKMKLRIEPAGHGVSTPLRATLHPADCFNGGGRPSASSGLREPSRIAFGTAQPIASTKWRYALAWAQDALG